MDAVNISRKYQPLILEKSRKFHNLSVDFKHSSVHVPTDIFDESKPFHLISLKLGPFTS